jgi:hypothetical protein
MLLPKSNSVASDTMEKFWAALLVPFYLLFVLALIGIPVTWLIRKLPPDSKLRKLLLTRIS